MGDIILNGAAMKKTLLAIGVAALFVTFAFALGINANLSKVSVDSFTVYDSVHAEVVSLPPAVTINIEPYSIIYEGDIINCTITGNPTVKYWQINNQSQHTTFHNDNPVIFDPEPTPLNDTYVNLTVYVENEAGNVSDTVQVIIKRIFFGDIHWHTTYGDGGYELDTMYQNAVVDNYLDFAASSEHASINPLYAGKPFPIVKMLINKFLGRDPWQIIKNKAVEYYDPGNFTTLLGFEWSSSNLFPGGYKCSPNGYEDVGHVNFYYKDVYPNAPKYSPLQKLNYDDIFQAMAEEWDKGHLNICFPHHPIGKIYWFGSDGFGKYIPFIYTTNWSFLARGMKNTDARDKILRGVEVYSRWGTSIGQYSNIPITWPYLPDDLSNGLCLCNQTDAWVENGMWEWSENSLKGRKFVMQAGSDTHAVDRPGSGSAELDKQKPSGIIAAYAVHNIRDEIWDAMNDCDIYGSQLLKIRANIRFDGKMAYGRWINCSSPLNIRITVHSTFPGFDSSGKNMCPHGYSPDELDYPIQDIWLIKKDRDKGRPWCKVIGHVKPDENMAVVTFEDPDVQSNDFYYVAIRQKGQSLDVDSDEPKDEYMAFIGPVFIDNVGNVIF